MEAGHIDLRWVVPMSCFGEQYRVWGRDARVTLTGRKISEACTDHVAGRRLSRSTTEVAVEFKKGQLWACSYYSQP